MVPGSVLCPDSMIITALEILICITEPTLNSLNEICNKNKTTIDGNSTNIALSTTILHAVVSSPTVQLKSYFFATI